MKKLIYIILLLPFISTAQVQYLGGVKTTVKNRGALQTDSLFVLPKHDTDFVNFTSADSIGRVVMLGNNVFFRDSTAWQQMNVSTATLDTKVSYSDTTNIIATHTYVDNSIAAIPVLDTTSLSDRIDTKVTKGGDSDGATLTIGTNDVNSLVLETNNTTALTINSSQVATFNNNITVNTIPFGRANSSDLYSLKIGSGGNASGTQNVTIGYNAGVLATINNVMIGVNAGRYLSGSDNVVIGALAASNNTGGTNGNTIVGRSAMSNLSGSNNTVMGYVAGALASGNTNTFLGVLSGYQVGGNNNIAIGYNALYGTAGNTAANNAAIGYQSAYNIAGAAQYNSYFGAYRSGYSMTTGSYNTILGNWRGTGFTTVSGYTFLSYGKGANASLGTYLDSAGQLYHRNFPTGASTDSVLTVSNNLVRKQPPYNYYTGWATYQDTLYTSGSPFSLTAATKYTLPNRAHIIIDSQMPIDIDSMYNRTDSTITGREGDGLNIVIEFKIKPTTVLLTKLTVSIDIGGTIGEIYTRDFILTKGSGVEHYYLSSFAGYTLDTWESNGGKVKVEVDNAADIYDIRYVLTRTHKAR